MRGRDPSPPRASLDNSDEAARRAFARMSQVSWALTAALTLVVIAILAASRLDYEAGRWPLNVATFAVFGVVALVYTYLRRDMLIASIADAVALLSAYTFVAAVFTYEMTLFGAGTPFWDARFLAADHAIGFDWLAWLSWLNARPNLAALLDGAYLSILKQVPVLILGLALARRYARLQIVLLAAQLSLLVCGLSAWLMPAIGAYAHLGVQAAVHHADIALATRDLHVAEVMQLRGDAPVVTLSRIEGVIVLPSFHMTLAILFAWGFWAVRILRWPGLAANVAMALATPLSGGHYMVDLVAGALLAIACLAAASAVRAALGRRVESVSALPRTPASAAALPFASG